MNSTALERVRVFLSRSQVQRSILCVGRAAPNQHPIHTLIKATSSNARNKFNKPISMVQQQPMKKYPYRMISDWNQKRSRIGRSNLDILVINLSLGVFMAYFLWLREPNDIDEYMSRPIWERLPGIDPERAEKMMEMDKRLGFQVDTSGLEQYKREYYAHQLAKMEEESKAEERHRKLRTASKDHFKMLQEHAQKDKD